MNINFVTWRFERSGEFLKTWFSRQKFWHLYGCRIYVYIRMFSLKLFDSYAYTSNKYIYRREKIQFSQHFILHCFFIHFLEDLGLIYRFAGIYLTGMNMIFFAEFMNFIWIYDYVMNYITSLMNKSCIK